MGSFNIEQMRKEYPGKSDAEAAKAFAEHEGAIAIVRYKNDASESDFTDIATCRTAEDIKRYFASPYCHQTEIIYDGR